MKRLIIIMSIILGGLATFLLCPVRVQAADDATILDNAEITTSVNYYAVFYSESNDTYAVFWSDTENFIYYLPNKNDYMVCIPTNSDCKIDCSSLDEVKTTLINASFAYDALPGNYSMEYPGSEHSAGKLLYCNKDVITQGSGEVFFQRTPCLALQPTIAGGLTAEAIAKALMAEQIGVLPLVVGLVILVITLFKGYRFLSTQLKAA